MEEAKTCDFSEKTKILYKEMYWESEPGDFDDRLRDVEPLDGEDECAKIVDHNNQDFLDFKKFAVVGSYSDHIIGKYMEKKESELRSMMNVTVGSYVKEELENDLPEGIFIRTYKSKPQLLRVVVVGAKGTPYQDGLYFFDVYLPCTYPDKLIHPTLRLHSAGLQIHPNIYRCGQVDISESSAAGLYLKKQGLVTFKIGQLLVFIKDVLLNEKPMYHEYRISPILREQESVLYNECVIIKSLKVMAHIMNKPPKHFEAFVVGHFRCRTRDILMACEGYLNGRFINGELEKRCSIAFKNEVASCMKPLIKAFIRIGSQEAYSFLRLSEDTIAVPREQWLTSCPLKKISQMPAVRVIVDDEVSQPNETENEEGPSDCAAKRQCIRKVGVDFEGTNPTPRRAQDNVTGQVDLHTVATHLNSYRSLLSKLACSDGIVVSRQSVLSQLARLDEIQVSQQSLLRMSEGVSQAALVEYDPSHIDIVEDASEWEGWGVGAAATGDADIVG